MAVFAVALLAGCYPGSDITCSPEPFISGTPAAVATAAFAYEYIPHSRYMCWLGQCSGIEAVQLPAGAHADSAVVRWTPSLDQVGTRQHFEIRTPEDFCGGRAGQAWDVTVYAPPVIDAFTASRPAVSPGEAVSLTAVFHGGAGALDGIGPVQSGVAIGTPALQATTDYTLTVTNEVGAASRQGLRVAVLQLPTIDAFGASPAIITTGETATLTWNIGGDVDGVRLDPGDVDVTGLASLSVAPLADTSYTLRAANGAGGRAAASATVRVVPPPAIDELRADPVETGYGGTVRLVATFRDGAGAILDVGPIASGTPLEVGPLRRSTTFRLSVENEAGAGATRDVRVLITGPQTFRPTRGAPIDPARTDHAAVLLVDGRVLLAGGGGAAGVLDTTELFDPATETFAAGPRLVAARRNPAAAVLGDGRVLVVGGVDAGQLPLTSAELLDPAAGTSASVGPAGGALVMPVATMLPDGRALVVHGSPQWGAATFDPEALAFAAAGTYPTGAVCLALAPLPDGRVLVVAGLGGASALFDPATASFAPTGALGHGRCYYAAAALRDGRVLVAGGDAQSEVYDAASGAFADAGAPIGRISQLAGGTLADGRALFAGGLADGWASYAARIFDPAMGTFADTGGLSCPRRFHTLTPLRDGRALVAGGCEPGFDADLVGAEIYTP